jgi:limonene-1,2-epoxide hydrolase
MRIIDEVHIHISAENALGRSVLKERRDGKGAGGVMGVRQERKGKDDERDVVGVNRVEQRW